MQEFKQQFKIEEIFDVSKLQRIQDDIAETLGISIMIVTKNGEKIITKSKYPEYCVMQMNDMFSKACCKAERIDVSEISINKCKNEYVSISIPIEYEGSVLGNLFLGQINKGSNLENCECLNINEEFFIRDNREDKNKIYDYEDIFKLKFKIKELVSHLVEFKVEKYLKKEETAQSNEYLDTHSIINLLNNINNSAIVENAYETSEIIKNSTDMIRYKIGKENQKKVTIRDELNNLDMYIESQMVKYGNNLTYKKNIDTELINEECPHMLIQPIVADTINNRLFIDNTYGEIILSIFSKGNDIVIEIKDNGISMKEDKIKSIYEDELNNETDSDLKKINHKLINKYGQDYRLIIDNKINKYTCIILRIPKRVVK